MAKPKVTFKEFQGWFNGRACLGGIKNHPRKELNGRDVNTSAVVSYSGEVDNPDSIETLNTLYVKEKQ